MAEKWKHNNLNLYPHLKYTDIHIFHIWELIMYRTNIRWTFMMNTWKTKLPQIVISFYQRLIVISLFYFLINGNVNISRARSFDPKKKTYQTKPVKKMKPDIFHFSVHELVKGKPFSMGYGHRLRRWLVGVIIVLHISIFFYGNIKLSIKLFFHYWNI